MATEILHSPIQAFEEPKMEYVDTETRVGETYLTPGFRQHLEKYFLKAPAENRAKCIELLTSLEIGAALRKEAEKYKDVKRTYSPCPPRDDRPPGVPKRPKTAMAALGSDKYLDPYTTTYTRTFAAIPGESATAERPGSSRFQPSYDLSGPVGNTTYQMEYFKKKEPKAEPIRTGSASGNRRNNPHPLEAFMQWRIPANTIKEQPGSLWSAEPTDAEMDRVCRGKLKSTYQQDYLGIPQGYQVKSAYSAPEDWKSKVPYTLDSTVRHYFQRPNQHPQLKGNSLRYGCNKKKAIPAIGVVPAVSNRQMNMKTRTTYEREYHTYGHQPQDVRDLGRHYGGQSLLKYMDTTDGPEKEHVSAMVENLNQHNHNSMYPHPPSSRGSSRCSRRPVVPPTTCLVSPSANVQASPLPL